MLEKRGKFVGEISVLSKVFYHSIPLMNSRFVQTLCLLLLLSSCKSLQLASKNNSSQSTVAKKKNTQFLDDISITPGEKKSSDYKPVQPSSKKSVENTSA